MFISNRQQDENNPNFVLSGVLIYAAAKIFGRKVDCLEQEILGVAKNFEKVDAENGTDMEKDPAKGEGKKTRTKKYTIKDGVNIDKILFEEKEIIIAVKEDINKTLAVPSKISRLQKMKDFFARNKEKSGKIAIPKSMLLSTELAVTNFGSSLIHDYDDYKDIVGSRRDFTSFSFFINSCTGELQNDLNFSKNSSKSSDFVLMDNDHPMETNLVNSVSEIVMEKDIEEKSENVTNESDVNLSEELTSNDNDINMTENLTPAEIDDLTPPLTPASPALLSGKVSPINLNLDEGIEIDIDQSSLLLPIQPVVKICDFLRKSPGLFPDSVNMNDSVEVNFQNSLVSVLDEIQNSSNDFSLPETLKMEVRDTRMKNIFMIPLKKLKHKCLFDLPDNEFKELKRRKLDQHKSTVEPPVKQPRLFKFLDLLKQCNMPSQETSISVSREEDEDAPFLGFTKEEQNESNLPIPFNNFKEKSTIIADTDDSHQTTIDDIHHSENIDSNLRKVSNDSGYTSEYLNSSNDMSSICNETSSQAENSQNDSSSLVSRSHEDSESTAQKNISGADSCYQSLVSGQSGNEESKILNISSFIDEFSVNNSTENEVNVGLEKDEQQASLESEERIQQMKQSAINVSS